MSTLNLVVRPSKKELRAEDKNRAKTLDEGEYVTHGKP
jgi:hypothetical protein